LFFGCTIAVIGARLYYVVFNWHEFNGDLKKIINIRTGGLAIYGGLIAAVITAYFFARVKKIDFLLLADFGSPYFVLPRQLEDGGILSTRKPSGQIPIFPGNAQRGN